MNFSPETLAAIISRPVNDNLRSTLRGLTVRPLDLSAPHRLCHYLGQVAHESGLWQYDRELWGPTPAQKRYDARTDLGNTPQLDGDGFLYRGRGPIQVTGRANYSAFSAWARALDAKAPNFVADPGALVSDPWEGLSAIWYWETRNLSALADVGDIEGITRRINGGTNGLVDRIKWTVAFGIAFSGSKTITGFQRDHQLVPDGIAGPITRGVLHKVLSHCPPVLFALT